MLLCGASAGGFPADLRDAPEFLPVFTPRLHREAYRTLVSPRPLEDVLRQLASDPRLLHPPGSWTASPAAPIDAFGNAATYDRWRLARLYGAGHPRVARGPVAGPDGRVAEAWTLISPHPDTSLTRLEAGTLIVVLRVSQR